MTHTYKVTGMTCAGCTAKVKNELLKTGDITAAEVQLQAPQATITMQKHVPVKILQEAISRAGHYTIEETEESHSMPAIMEDEPASNSYFPVFLIFGYITVITLLAQWARGGFEWMSWMRYFMAGFFLVFSFFKLMNLRGFAEGYGTYDVVARKIPVWGFIYPFIELGLGFAFLLNIFPLATTITTLVVMSVSCIGVIQVLLKKQRFQCACLGTIIKLPLSKVTLLEDLLMVTMSGITLLFL